MYRIAPPVTIPAALVLFWFTSNAAAQPYSIPNTEVRAMHSKNTGVDYQIFVSLPAARPKGKQYPVVYMLDADYSFALVRNVVQHFVERNDLPPLILVAIAYPGAATHRDTYKLNRTRDYTPVYAPEGGYGAEYQKVSGGAAKFRAFITTELVPSIERDFPALPGDRALIGHSYGGLFATYVLLTEPALFKRYIVVSPSLWYSERIVFTMEEAAAKLGLRPDARVFLAVGALENPVMASDLTELTEKLRSHNNPKLRVETNIYEGERHNSVFPGAVTRGLLTVFDRPELPPGATPQPNPIPSNAPQPGAD
jgi:predicted alpha/beta superfamily hydrolase